MPKDCGMQSLNIATNPVSQPEVAHRPAPPAAVPDAASTLREHATPVRARRRQRLALEMNTAEVVYIVRSGTLCVEASPPGKHRQLLALLYPGDIIRRSLVPDLPGVTLSALNVAEVWRLPLRTYETLLGSSIAVTLQAQRQLGEQHARAALHAAIVGGLMGEERLAALLIELGRRLGVAGPSGVTFDSPLSRTDIADYLALNADTLSRITSRFKSRGLLASNRAGHTTLPAWDALRALCPVEGALAGLHGERTA